MPPSGVLDEANAEQSIPPGPWRRLRAALRTSGIEATVRLGFVAVLGGLGALGGWFAGLGLSPDEREARRGERREANLLRLVAHMGHLKGVFVKAGQFAALRLDLLPAPVQQALEGLHENVPPLPFSDIRHQVETQLGGSLSSHFASFERVPIGAASIAQVHQATLLDGTSVAVKVQYPWIARSLRADLAVLNASLVLLALLGRRKIPDRRVLFAEFAAGLEEELDFEREARTATRIASNLAEDERVVVPQVYSEKTRRGLLTMGYFRTLPLDGPTLRERGIHPRPIVETLVRAYAKQVFIDGLFHADPHPGNLFVLDEPEASHTPRVLFVDFGLSKQLATPLRNAMRKGLYALVQRDPEAFVERMEEMGMVAPGCRSEVFSSVSEMFRRVSRAGEDNANATTLGISGNQVLGLKDEAKQLLRDTPGLQLPTDLLLYAKTLSYLFALAERLDPEVDALRLSLPYLLRFLAEREKQNPAPRSTSPQPKSL